MKECCSDTQTNEQKDVCNLSTLSEAEKKTALHPPKNHHIYTREPNLLKGNINSSPDLIQMKNSPSKLMIYPETIIKITSMYALSRVM